MTTQDSVMDELMKKGAEVFALAEALEAADSRLVGLERCIATDDLESYIKEQRGRRALIRTASPGGA